MLRENFRAEFLKALKLFRYPLLAGLTACLSVLGEWLAKSYQSKPLVIVFAVCAGIMIVTSALLGHKVVIRRRQQAWLLLQIFDQVHKRITINSNQPLLVGNDEVCLALMPAEKPNHYYIYRRSMTISREAFFAGEDWWVQEGEAFEVAQSLKPKVAYLGQMIIGEINVLERNEDGGPSMQSTMAASRDVSETGLSVAYLSQLRDQIRDCVMIPASWRQTDDGWSFNAMLDFS